MEKQKIWVLEYTIESRVPIFRSHQLTTGIEVFATKEMAEMHAKWFVDYNVKNGWTAEDDLDGKKLYHNGCIPKGYRILETEVINPVKTKL